MPEETRTDEVLVQAYLTDENAAFDRLVERYQERLIRFAHPITLNYEDAEDVVQETFLDVWQNIRRFEPTRKFSSWIYKICRNRALKIIRDKHLKFEPLPIYVDPFEDLSQAGESESEKLQKIETLRAVPLEKWADWAKARETHARILAVLNHRQYRLYDLVMVKGRPYEAIPQEEKLFRDMTPDEVREEFDRVLGIVWTQAEKEKEKWRGKKPQSI